jgi:hypothetical protein
LLALRRELPCNYWALSRKWYELTMPMNDDMKIRKEVDVKYYVADSTDYIYGGPFYTRKEAQECLKKWKKGNWSRKDYGPEESHGDPRITSDRSEL